MTETEAWVYECRDRVHAITDRVTDEAIAVGVCRVGREPDPATAAELSRRVMARVDAEPDARKLREGYFVWLLYCEQARRFVDREQRDTCGRMS